ncbi:25183_t:CDS:2, partial [Gigaspora rosea]
AIAIGTRKHYNIYYKKDTLRGSLSDKTNICSSTQWKMRVEKQGFSTSQEEKDLSQARDLVLKIVQNLASAPVKSMDMDETKLPASNLIQNTSYHY